MDIKPEDWLDVRTVEPEEGGMYLVYNGIRPLAVKHYHAALHRADVPFPVTHVLAINLPYKPVAEDKTNLDGDRNTTQRNLGKWCTTGCGLMATKKGRCNRCYMRALRGKA